MTTASRMRIQLSLIAQALSTGNAGGMSHEAVAAAVTAPVEQALSVFDQSQHRDASDAALGNKLATVALAIRQRVGGKLDAPELARFGAVTGSTAADVKQLVACGLAEYDAHREREAAAVAAERDAHIAERSRRWIDAEILREKAARLRAACTYVPTAPERD